MLKKIKRWLSSTQSAKNESRANIYYKKFLEDVDYYAQYSSHKRKKNLLELADISVGEEEV